MKHRDSHQASPVAQVERLEDRILLDTASVALGAGGNQWLAFTDGDGSAVTVRLNRAAQGNLELEADGAVVVTAAGRGATAAGTNLRMNTLEITTPAGVTNAFLGVSGGDGQATLGEVDAAGLPLGNVRAADIVLQGGAGLAADSVRSLALAGANNTAVDVTNALGRLGIGAVDTLTLTAATGATWRFQSTVTDSNITVGRIGSLIFDGDVDPTVAQVLIEARLVQVNENFADSQLDIASLHGTGTFRGDVTGSQVTFGAADGRLRFQRTVLNSTVDVPLAGRGVSFDALINSDVLIGQAGRVSANMLSGGTFGLANADLSVALRALQNNADVNILSAPRVTVINGQQATIQVDQARRYSMIGDFQDVNVVLDVVPHVSARGHFINLTLDVNMVDSLNFNGDLLGGGVTVNNAVNRRGSFNGAVNGANIDINQIPFLGFSRDVINTTVTVPDGGTILLGGRRSEVRDSTFNVPLLGKLPILGRLFRNNTIETETTLLILIKPTVIDSEIDPVLLGTVKLLNGMTNSTIIADEIQHLTILGPVDNSVVYSGVDLGVDGLFNTGDETWTAGSIGRLSLLGRFGAGSLVGVGVDPGIDGLFFTGDDVGIGGAIEQTAFRRYEVVATGDPANAFGLIAAEGIAPFSANGQVIAPTEGSPFADGDFNAAVTGVI